MAEFIVALENRNHFHVWFGFVFIQDLEPVLDWLSILCLNGGKVALRAFYFFTHKEKLLLNDKNPSRRRGFVCGD